MHSSKVTTVTPEVIDSLLNSLCAKGRSENTLKAYRSDLSEFLRWAERPISMEEFEDQAMIWLNNNRRIVAPKTTGRRLSSLRCFARWAGQPGLLTEYSAPTPARAMPHPIPEGMDGVRRMIEAAEKINQKAVVAFGGFVGCRIAETLAVTAADFNFGEMTLTIRGKGDKQRIVPVSDEAWTVIQRPVLDTAIRDMNAPVIDYKDRFARKVVTDLGNRADLTRSVSSHDLRATFATAVYDKTKDIRLVQELLGHASSQTTELYTGVKLESMRSAVNL